MKVTLHESKNMREKKKRRRKLEHPKHIHLKWQCMHVYVQECARIHKLQANLKT